MAVSKKTFAKKVLDRIRKIKSKVVPTPKPKPKKKVAAKRTVHKKVAAKRSLKPRISKKKVQDKKPEAVKQGGTNLQRHFNNPIINPSPSNTWESKATFNPTAIAHDGKIHIVYRAVGDDDNSVLGYAISDDGVSITEQHPIPMYSHSCRPNRRNRNIAYSSGGGWGGGSEDPRLILLEDRIYLFYTAFDGWGSVRVAFSSISLEDFLNKNFEWDPPIIISPPGQIHKNWVLFPEKINGKYAILHSISPEIMIDYFDSMDHLDGDTFIYSVHQGSPLWEARDKQIRGVGPAPIKTKYGWLILYHAMERHDPNRYKLFAMVTDAENPSKILYRSKGPVLEPDEWYENEGYKRGVIYACGAVVKEGTLFVYYGGADKVSCVASADFDAFLSDLVATEQPKLKKGKIKKK